MRGCETGTLAGVTHVRGALPYLAFARFAQAVALALRWQRNSKLSMQRFLANYCACSALLATSDASMQLSHSPGGGKAAGEAADVQADVGDLAAPAGDEELDGLIGAGDEHARCGLG